VHYSIDFPNSDNSFPHHSSQRHTDSDYFILNLKFFTFVKIEIS